MHIGIERGMDLFALRRTEVVFGVGATTQLSLVRLRPLNVPRADVLLNSARMLEQSLLIEVGFGEGGFCSAD
jgi:hypothetical protein